jgi:protein-tyrosine-phosphatase
MVLFRRSGAAASLAAPTASALGGNNGKTFRHKQSPVNKDNSMPLLSIKQATNQLQQQADIIFTLASGMTNEEYRYRPSDSAWSIIEIINHLADEEYEDFRLRLDLLLFQPGSAWPTIDPPRSVKERNHQARELSESLARFLAEREHSLEWLRELHAAPLDTVVEHGQLRLSGHDLLAAWLAHDLLHIRQITQRRYQYLAARVAPASIAYAGDWR